MKTHNLKTIQPYFNEVRTGKKTFEHRKNDRDFQVNDRVILQEYDTETKIYSGRELNCIITYVLKDFFRT